MKTAYGKTMTRMRNQTISNWLQITPAEADWLETLSSAGESAEPSASQSNRTNRRAYADTRRAMIQQIVTEGGHVPPCRTMTVLLQKRGVAVGYVQVSKHYQVLQLKTKRSLKLQKVTDRQQSFSNL